MPDEILSFTLSSRYCPTEALAQVAWDLFGQSDPGWSRVQAICDWVHQHMRYGMATTSLTTSVDVYVAGGGMCRDFAHLAITFCRALTIPARYVFGYLPDIDVTGPQPPMDFHAWFEVYLDGRWWTFDARFNRPRIGRIPIGYGRDAVDVAMVTTYGSAVFQQMVVWSDPVTDALDVVPAQREWPARSGMSEGLILGSARREPS
ncbi:MAG: transglutaminase-like domain-containing protein [Thermomicrobiales bacterium]